MDEKTKEGWVEKTRTELGMGGLGKESGMVGLLDEWGETEGMKGWLDDWEKPSPSLFSGFLFCSVFIICQLRWWMGEKNQGWLDCWMNGEKKDRPLKNYWIGGKGRDCLVARDSSLNWDFGYS